MGIILHIYSLVKRDYKYLCRFFSLYCAACLEADTGFFCPVFSKRDVLPSSAKCIKKSSSTGSSLSCVAASLYKKSLPFTSIHEDMDTRLYARPSGTENQEGSLRPPPLHGHTPLMALSPHPFPAASRMKLMPTGGTNIPHPSCMIHLAISPRVSSAPLTVYPSSCAALAWLNRPLEASTPTE